MAALGVVFGDIGTSPLYAFREALRAVGGEAASVEAVLGILSLIVWSLIVIVTIKYLAVVMRADNEGEGGVLALTALLMARRGGGRLHGALIGLGIFGTALLYGDGMITPAISVLASVEGLDVAVPGLGRYVIPLACLVLVGLFAVQRRGTAAIGAVFGPATLLWFVVLAVLGVRWLATDWTVLRAVNPTYAIAFVVGHPGLAFAALGGIFLVVTGSEALYADMGHFGKRPIRLAWAVVVFPALVLNYFGQGALILHDPAAADNPFYRMAPTWGVIPLIVLATIATVIASQALISGAFSITRQAVQLGYLPRVRVDQTSRREYGQIYVPVVNWGLMVAAIALVVGFGSSEGLAAAYGIAVTITMVITALLLAAVMWRRWGWSRLRVATVTAAFLVVDVAYFAANIVKVVDGGWVPLAVGFSLAGVMAVWKFERNRMLEITWKTEPSLERFIGSIGDHPQPRVEGTAVYLSPKPAVTPPVLLSNLRHNQVLHERVLIVTVSTETRPVVLPARRATVHPLGEGFFSVILHFGFSDVLDVPHALGNITMPDFGFDGDQATYFLGNVVVDARGRGIRRWPVALFARLHRNTPSPARQFRLPIDQVVEFGDLIVM